MLKRLALVALLVSPMSCSALRDMVGTPNPKTVEEALERTKVNRDEFRNTAWIVGPSWRNSRGEYLYLCSHVDATKPADVIHQAVCSVRTEEDSADWRSATSSDGEELKVHIFDEDLDTYAGRYSVTSTWTARLGVSPLAMEHPVKFKLYGTRDSRVIDVPDHLVQAQSQAVAKHIDELRVAGAQAPSTAAAAAAVASPDRKPELTGIVGSIARALTGEGEASDPPGAANVPETLADEPRSPGRTWPSKRTKDIAWTISRVSIRRIDYAELSLPAKSAKEFLVIELQANNQATRRIARFSSGKLDMFTKPRFALTDDFGNRIARRGGGFIQKIEGALEDGAEIYPGKERTHVIVFEVPPAATRSLTLRVRGEAFQTSGKVEFEITREDLGWPPLPEK